MSGQTKKLGRHRVWGYARVSTDDQDMSYQRAALENYGVDGIWEEKASGATMDRKVLKTMMHEIYMRPGDTLVIWKLDRLGRTLTGVLEMIEELNRRNITLVSLTDGFDETTAMGRAMMKIALVFAELERELISERTKARMALGKEQGQRYGRKFKITDNEKRMKHMRKLDAEGKLRDAEGEMLMTDRAVMAELNKADPKAEEIESLETVRRWRRANFPGLVKTEQS